MHEPPFLPAHPVDFDLPLGLGTIAEMQNDVDRRGSRGILPIPPVSIGPHVDGISILRHRRGVRQPEQNARLVLGLARAAVAQTRHWPIPEILGPGELEPSLCAAAELHGPAVELIEPQGGRRRLNPSGPHHLVGPRASRFGGVQLSNNSLRQGRLLRQESEGEYKEGSRIHPFEEVVRVCPRLPPSGNNQCKNPDAPSPQPSPRGEGAACGRAWFFAAISSWMRAKLTERCVAHIPCGHMVHPLLGERVGVRGGPDVYSCLNVSEGEIFLQMARSALDLETTSVLLANSAAVTYV